MPDPTIQFLKESNKLLLKYNFKDPSWFSANRCLRIIKDNGVFNCRKTFMLSMKNLVRDSTQQFDQDDVSEGDFDNYNDQDDYFDSYDDQDDDFDNYDDQDDEQKYLCFCIGKRENEYWSLNKKVTSTNHTFFFSRQC